MSNLSRNELIKALVKGLKLDDNVFNYQSVAEEIEQIQEHQFMDFYKAVMKEDTFGNGLKAIMNTVEKFKPVVEDHLEAKANELIDLVHSMNNSVYQKHIESGVRFDDLLDDVKFPSVSEADMAILNNVAPHYDLKTLIAKINHYGTAKDALTAFKRAIEKTSSGEVMAIGNATQNLRIKR